MNATTVKRWEDHDWWATMEPSGALKLETSVRTITLGRADAITVRDLLNVYLAEVGE